MLIAGFGRDVLECAQKHISTVISTYLSDTDVLASLQGAQLALILEGMAAKKIFVFLEKLLNLISSTPMESEDEDRIELTVSVGCEIESGQSFAHLVDLAVKNVSYVESCDGNGVMVRKGSGKVFLSPHLISPVKQSPVQRSISKKFAKFKESKKILLVDDSKIIRKIVSGYLHELGDFHCDEAKNGKEGLGKLKSGDYDIVFFDVAMPVMNGIDAAGIARKEFPALFIVMLTAEYDLSDKAREIGVNDYVTKPFDAEKIWHCLSGLGFK